MTTAWTADLPATNCLTTNHSNRGWQASKWWWPYASPCWRALSRWCPATAVPGWVQCRSPGKCHLSPRNSGQLQDLYHYPFHKSMLLSGAQIWHTVKGSCSRKSFFHGLISSSSSFNEISLAVQWLASKVTQVCDGKYRCSSLYVLTSAWIKTHSRVSSMLTDSSFEISPDKKTIMEISCCDPKSQNSGSLQ